MSIDVNAIDQTVEVTAVGDEINVNIIDQPVLVSVTDQIIEVAASAGTGPQGPAGAGVAAGGTTGQVLSKLSNTNYDTVWVNAGAGTVYSVNASGSTGISVTGGPITGAGTLTITNTAPDQVVGLTGAGTAVITGTYPNFTITTNDQFNGTVTSVNLTAGTGISVSGGPITTSGNINVVNTSPDQVVSLTSGGTTTITGTYPNFTISSADSKVGTVTSVNMTVPTGLTISGNPITSAGTLALALASGYSIPTTASQATWDAAYNDKINSAAVTGTTTKTLTLNQQDGGTITASWTDINTDAVTSVFGRTGAVVATGGDYSTSQVTEVTNLYYTEGRVSANSDVAANTAARHNAVTLGTANGLTLSTQALSLALASGSTTGALSSTDFSTFNSKQNALSGTGFVKISGTTISYDNSTYYLASNPSAFIALTALSGSTGISYNNTTGVITNSAPDQTVSITAGSGISVSGTYPSFTVASTITQYTDALARAAISLTVTGGSGASTYNNTTGVLNVPTYTLSGLGGVPSTRSITINGTTQDLSADRTFTIASTNIYNTDGTLTGNRTLTNGGYNLIIAGSTYNNRFTAAGRLLLGTTTESTYILDVNDKVRIKTNLEIKDSLVGAGSGTGIEINTNVSLPRVDFVISSVYVGQFSCNSTDVRFASNLLSSGGIIFDTNQTGSAATRMKITNAGRLLLGTTAESTYIFDAVGTARVSSSITASSFIKSGGTSSQFLKADGSVDSTAYGTGSVTSVAATAGTGITISGSPITSSGTLTITNSAPDQVVALTGAGTTTISGTYPNFTISSSDSAVGTVTSVGLSSATSGVTIGSTPVTTSGTITLAIATATGSQNGLLSSIDYNTFIGKQNAITLTTTGTSGAATLVGATLNIPNYADQFVGTVTSVAALTLATTGTDLSSSVANGTTTPVITLNVPTASATNRGALSSADWSTFNSKQGTITLTTTGTSGAATFSSNTLNIPQYQAVLTNPVTGTGTTNYLPKWNGTTSLGNSVIFENGTNIGIGITNADYPLTVSQINVGGAGANLGIILDSVISTAIPSSSVKAIIGATNSGFGFAAGSLLLQPRTGVNASLAFATEGTEKMRLDYLGNLGIGTTSPSYKLDVVAGNNDGVVYRTSTRSIGIGQISSEASLFWGSTTALTFFSGSERMRLDASGNLGLGVTPSAWVAYTGFQIGTQGSIGATSTVINFGQNVYYGASGYLYIANGNAAMYQMNDGVHGWRIAGTGTAGNAITFTQAMTLDASGNLGLGTTSPSGFGAGYATMDLKGSTGSGIKIGNTTDVAYLFANSTATFLRTASSKDLIFGTFDTERLRITSGGNVGIGTTSPAAKFVVSNAGASGLEIDPIGGVGSGVLFQAYNRSTSAYMAQSYYALSHTFNVGSGGSTRVLDITSGGDLGLGTTAPTNKFDLQVANKSTIVATASAINVNYSGSTTGQYQTIGFSWDSSTGNKNSYWGMGFTGTSYGSGTGDLFFFTGGNTRLTIASTGAATFSSTASATAFIPTGSSVPTNGMYLSAANTLDFATNSVNRLNIGIDASFSGNVYATGFIGNLETSNNIRFNQTLSTSSSGASGNYLTINVNGTLYKLQLLTT